ncbi:MAG TPA: GAF and ANTAR domain-containing protein [Sinomonas sp.]|nr:GAF and ANTAR domain-containing protein [Sinomonas sp.]
MRSEWTRFDVAELQGILLESPDLKSFLFRLTQVAAQELSRRGTAYCSVTVLRERRWATVGFSEEFAVGLDDLQYSTGEGPCMTALKTGRVVHVADLVHEQRWPAYRPPALESGIRSILAVPIVLDLGAQAALNCYTEEAGAFDVEAKASVEAFADLAASSVRLAVRLETEMERSSDLKAALESRTAINLASGVIMAQSGCTQEQAVEILRRAAISRNVKLRDVASQILARFGEVDPATHFD